MSIDVNKLIKVEHSDLGYSESPTGSNKTKYGVKYGLNGQPWCLISQWYWFDKIGYSKYFYGGKKCASCTEFMNYYKKNYPKQVVYKDYKVGDLLLFQFDTDLYPDHVGLCTEVNTTTVCSIEGNTGTLSQDNGGKVMERVRDKKLILCGIRWWEIEESTDTKKEIINKVTVTLDTLKNGSKGEQVKTLQIILNTIGYSCGKADSDFGDKTLKAVKKFQVANKLVGDGVVGKNTWNKLLKGE